MAIAAEGGLADDVGGRIVVNFEGLSGKEAVEVGGKWLF